MSKMCVRSECQGLGVQEEIRKKALQKKTRKQKLEAMALHTASLQHLQSTTSGNQAKIKQDMIAVVTAQYKLLLLAVGDMFDGFQKSNTYKVLFHTTQPAHLITFLAVTIVAALFVPRGDVNPGQPDAVQHSPLMNFIYLTSFMTHFGAQVWMTFVSGLSLYFAMPRHTFGSVQKVLFPKYFGINSFLSLVTVIVFVKLHPASSWDWRILAQVCSMVVCLFVELLTRLYLTPIMLELLAARNAMELAAGVGLEVGQHSVGPLALCPLYLAKHQAFRSTHMMVASGNILAMACTTFHLWYLANKIC